MATRSRIGIELKDGSITREQAAELIDGGDMSSCWADEIWGKKLPQGEYAPEYYSQRGEDCPPRYDETRDEFLSDGEEYSYIFTSAGWVCYDMNEFNDKQPERVIIPEVDLAV